MPVAASSASGIAAEAVGRQHHIAITKLGIADHDRSAGADDMRAAAGAVAADNLRVTVCVAAIAARVNISAAVDRDQSTRAERIVALDTRRPADRVAASGGGEIVGVAMAAKRISVERCIAGDIDTRAGRRLQQGGAALAVARRGAFPVAANSLGGHGDAGPEVQAGARCAKCVGPHRPAGAIAAGAAATETFACIGRC